jgi:hypothetical protein
MVGRLQMKRPLQKSSWEGDINMDSKKVDYGDVNSSEPA